MVWLTTALYVLVALAFIGLGAVVVRPVRPASGYMIAAAGAVELLTTCCLRIAFSFGGDAFGYDTLALVSTFVTVVAQIVVAGLLLAAVVGLAKELDKAS